jgi:hypothetical protein
MNASTRSNTAGRHRKPNPRFLSPAKAAPGSQTVGKRTADKGCVSKQVQGTDQHDTLPTAVKPKTRRRRITPSPADITKKDLCPCSRRSVSIDITYVQCDTCKQWWHHSCAGISDKNLHKYIDENNYLEYNCLYCQIDCINSTPTLKWELVSRLASDSITRPELHGISEATQDTCSVQPQSAALHPLASNDKTVHTVSDSSTGAHTVTTVLQRQTQ